MHSFKLSNIAVSSGYISMYNTKIPILDLLELVILEENTICNVNFSSC